MLALNGVAGVDSGQLVTWLLYAEERKQGFGQLVQEGSQDGEVTEAQGLLDTGADHLGCGGSWGREECIAVRTP